MGDGGGAEAERLRIEGIIIRRIDEIRSARSRSSMGEIARGAVEVGALRALLREIQLDVAGTVSNQEVQK